MFCTCIVLVFKSFSPVWSWCTAHYTCIILVCKVPYTCIILLFSALYLYHFVCIAHHTCMNLGYVVREKVPWVKDLMREFALSKGFQTEWGNAKETRDRGRAKLSRRNVELQEVRQTWQIFVVYRFEGVYGLPYLYPLGVYGSPYLCQCVCVAHHTCIILVCTAHYSLAFWCV